MKTSKMKKFIVALMILPIGSVAQTLEIPYSDGKIEYVEVVQVASTSSSELNTRANYYVNSSESATMIDGDSIQISFEALDVFIAGKDNLKIKMNYDVVIEFKDSRYRIICKNIKFTPYPDPFHPQPITITAGDVYRGYMENKR